MLYRTPNVIIRAAPDAVVFRVSRYVVAHDAGDYLQCLLEWLHDIVPRPVLLRQHVVNYSEYERVFYLRAYLFSQQATG